jgi:hypothetical protein
MSFRQHLFTLRNTWVFSTLVNVYVFMRLLFARGWNVISQANPLLLKSADADPCQSPPSYDIWPKSLTAISGRIQIQSGDKYKMVNKSFTSSTLDLSMTILLLKTVGMAYRKVRLQIKLIATVQYHPYLAAKWLQTPHMLRMTTIHKILPLLEGTVLIKKC